MRLKDGFITHEGIDGTLLLATGEEANAFHGIIKLNSTAAKIVEYLKKETSKEEILENFQKEYPSIPKETLSKDIDNVLSELETLHAIV